MNKLLYLLDVPKKAFFKKDKLLIIAGSGLFLILLSIFYFPQVRALITEETKQSSKTIKFFIFQSPSVLVSPASTSTDFSIFIGEQGPIDVKDAYIEIRGVTQISSGQTITADIKQQSGGESFPTIRQKQFTLDSTGKPNYFKLLYNGKDGSATSTLTGFLDDIINNPGTYNFTFKIDISGADVSLLQARMVITYKFTPPSAGGAYYAYGEIISPIFDTGAANGVEYNWIMASGTTPIGTAIKAQLATSNSSSSGSFTFRGGDNCNTTDYYSLTINQPKELKCFSDFNNRRYFQYKIRLCSSTDCSSAGSATPQAEKVIVNWSP